MPNYADLSRNLEDDFRSDTTRKFEKLLVSQCNAGRDDPYGVDDTLAEEDGQKIIDVINWTDNTLQYTTHPIPYLFCIIMEG